MHDHIKKTMKDGATDVKGLKAFLAEEIRILSHLQKEIVDEDKVQRGAIFNAVKEEGTAAVLRRAKRARRH